MSAKCGYLTTVCGIALVPHNHLPKTPLGGIHLSETKRRFLEGSLHPVNVLMCPHTCVTNLPKPSIDTGMGLERIAAVMQGVHDNYDIDTFKALIAASEHLTGVAAEGENRASHRVIADHLRSTSFLLADGVLTLSVASKCNVSPF